MRSWVIIPAAGTGKRMNSEMPKQYLSIGSRSVLEWTLQALQSVPGVQGTVLGLSEGDAHWAALKFRGKDDLLTVTGGAERAQTVINCIRAVSHRAQDDDWLLVHDAARPCLSQEALQRLFAALGGQTVGGLLAVPVADTLKNVDGLSRVKGTQPREALWQAQTPQVFRYGVLRDALTAAAERGVEVTDESSAVEQAGYAPTVVPGSRLNLKITQPEDLELARLILMNGLSA